MPRRVEAQLVEWLQDNEFLYNRGHHQYKNREKKRRAWQEMGASLVPPRTMEELTRWFHTRRTQYGKITKKTGVSGTGKSRLTQLERWVVDMFAFMLPHIHRHKETKDVGLPQVIKASNILVISLCYLFVKVFLWCTFVCQCVNSNNNIYIYIYIYIYVCVCVCVYSMFA